MTRAVIAGAGLAGLTAAISLARDGHEVTVLERDLGQPGADWRRPGVNQFRHIHLNLSDWLHTMRELVPELPERLLEAGALKMNMLGVNPSVGPDGVTDDDRRFETVTARRPVLERVLAELALTVPGVEIIRGAQVSGLLVDGSRITGLEAGGRHYLADLVIDASGRRSPLQNWLARAGLPAARETLAEASTAYYSRHFKSRDGKMPEFKAGTLHPYNGLSVITLPADNGTWSVAFLAREDDSELRHWLMQPDAWLKALAQYPAARHWADAEPLGDEVVTIAALHDRGRSLISEDGNELVSGLVLLGDAWACTDPSLGRGTAIAMRHVRQLRNALRELDPAQPGFTAAFEERSRAELQPVLDRSWSFMKNRLGEMKADALGEEFNPGPDWAGTVAGRRLESQSAELARGFGGIAYLLQGPAESFADPGLLGARIKQEIENGYSQYPLGGPTRAELLDILAATAE